MKNYEMLLIEVKDAIAFVTINNPKQLNALNVAVLNDLQGAFTELKDDPAVQAVILTGSGDKAFVAGADISSMVKMTVDEIRAYAYKAHDVFMLIDDFPKPVIGAINGFALGGGNELAMSCDIRLASEKAKFGQPELNLGIIPFFGGTQRLPKLVGKGMANYLILSTEMIGAQEALRIGLCERVYPADQLLAEAEKLARTILSKGPIAVKAALNAISTGLNTDLKSGVVIEVESAVLTYQSADKKEGMTAFLEKRPAKFTGK
ncbi:MAG: enoyl-CoA hydratase/isomerase family protein [Spirochaetaceae bacterium]|jgi:enoyl-CoA hydratase|nr:enoyl-CoA hydratase/isomerase family protein [Spirochaetaceae bacterium]